MPVRPNELPKAKFTATLTAIRPAEALPTMRIAIQRTASLSDIA
jgi:hypothetical protein